MRNGPYDDLPEERTDLIKWLFDATFGRIPATAAMIGRQIYRLGTLNFLLGKR